MTIAGSIVPGAASAALDGSVHSVQEAYAFCRNMASRHYENFPVASRFMPEDKRDPVAAVYAFARVPDDFADEPGLTPEQRLTALADWRRRLKTCLMNHHNHPVFWALADAIGRYGLPLDPFDRLITAFETDVRKNRYATFEEVLFYCRHSANPVGELVLRIFGAWNEKRGRWSDDICSALQLANFWQDITVDARKDRLYVPAEDYRAMKMTDLQVMRGPADTALRELVSAMVDRTWTLFRRGRPLCDDAPASLRRELRAVWLGGTRILEKIEKQRWDVWRRRPRLTIFDGPRLAARYLFWRPEA